MARVSIAIPAYNASEGVKRLLNSIDRQEYKDYEIIITDDSTNDDIYRLVKERTDIRYYKNDPGKGATGNWNEALRRCSGEYLKIMHHDDWFTDEKSLGRLVEMLESDPKADFVFCGTRQVEKDRCFDRAISDEDVELIRQDYRNLYLGNTIGAPSAVMHRRCGCVYDEHLTWLVDMEFYMNLLRGNPQFVYTREPLISIGVSDSQLTESCIGDRDINIYEYGYIYAKYELWKNKQYKNRLLQVLTEYEATYAQAAECGIPRVLYAGKRMKKWMSKVAWKLGIR